MIKIQIGSIVATIDNLEWSSENKDFARMLQAWTYPEQYGPEWPDKDLAAANDMIELFGGKIIERDEPPEPPKSRPGMVH